MKTIPLTKGQVALVDDSDYEELSKFKWVAIASKYTFYAIRRTGGKNISMHRQILSGSLIDHKDGNGLNNQRSNLRVATRSQNGANRRRDETNTTGFKGVHRHRDAFCAQIWINGVQKYLGRFPTPEKAHEAYKSAATKLYGEFARFE